MAHPKNDRSAIWPLACIYSQRFNAGKVDREATLQEFLKSVTETIRSQNVTEMHKCSAKAAKLRNVGNRHFLDRKFQDALACYNESICFADPNSDQLAMGYANRSAVYYEQDEYEFALLNIDLAKKNNYPEKLMPKLLARELNCKQRIAGGRSKNATPRTRMSVNVDTNPRIPFLADGIGMNYEPKFGRGLIAEKDFNPGDIILEEKSELCGVDFNLSYRNCNHCSSRFNYSLIPCPTCPFMMYCSQECLEQNWNLFHRFECCVVTKLYSVSSLSSMMHPRLFFYGLTQFDEDLRAMMKYCEKEINGKFNPLDLDYTNPNRLELFKAYHNTQPAVDPENDHFFKILACGYYVMYLKNPAVNSIIRTEPQRRFFLRSLLQYIRIGFSMASYSIDARGRAIGTLTPIDSLINHSCDPHAATFICSGTIKVVLLRPVRRGEQIFTSYGPVWWEEESGNKTPFTCRCVYCDRGPAGRRWRALIDRDFPLGAVDDLQKLHDIALRMDFNNAAKLNALKQFIKKHARHYPERNFGTVLDSYRMLLVAMNRTDVEALERARAWAEDN
ncbi:conserved hypothetical protein [Culex quinquefasciatus]|uniref:SET and MYND domain-containing protein 4 n=1 Tax=Culex quinquefasciatus TaxID=7176 RepID=B0WBC9_CULQU|nr:conserved hypothetical protein [Culex quinquefasciatus]|eukprot:XP_001846013.1 conserved hypothetical protein [Culex quinquefasciatus]